MSLIKIEYNNNTDFGDIFYQKGFTNRVYLDADVTKPEYPIEEEGITNGDGEFVPSHQRWSKLHMIECYGQEYLADALSLMELHDNIWITLKNGETSLVSDVEVEVDWQDTVQCWAKISIKFNVDKVIKTNCDTNMVTGCLQPDFECEAIYDADDGGTGQGYWEYPISEGVQNGAIYFFYNTYNSTYGSYSGDDVGVYMADLSINGWVKQEVSNEQLIDISGESGYVYLWKAGDTFYKSPFLISATDQGGQQVEIVARGFPGHYVRIEESPDDNAWSTIGQYGSEITTGQVMDCNGTGTRYFRAWWYTHGCSYGASASVSEVITS